jgi:hypothetical protein
VPEAAEEPAGGAGRVGGGTMARSLGDQIKRLINLL